MFLSFILGFLISIPLTLYLMNRKPRVISIKVHKSKKLNDIIEVNMTYDIMKLIKSNTDKCYEYGLTKPALVYGRLIIICDELGTLTFGFIVSNHEIEVIGVIAHNYTKQYFERYSKDIIELDDEKISMRCDDSIDINGVIRDEECVKIPFICKEAETTSLGNAMLSNTKVVVKYGLIDHEIYYQVDGKFQRGNKEWINDYV